MSTEIISILSPSSQDLGGFLFRSKLFNGESLRAGKPQFILKLLPREGAQPWV